MNRFSIKQLIYLLTITLAGVIFSVIFHFPLVIGFLPGYLVIVHLANRNNQSFKQIVQISIRGVYKTRIVILILFLVSFLLPSWYLSGTIDQMVKIALYLINPHYFYVLTFVAAMVFSMLLGTTVGTLSAIGIPILGTAVVLNLSTAVVAGALVSGAFVGDRTSPFSSANQLLAHTLELPVKKQWNAMFLTTIIAVVLSMLFYGVFDFFSTEKMIHTISFEWGELTFLKFIPPIILLVLVLFRLSIIYAFISSVLSAAIISILGGVRVSEVASAFWNGIEGLGGGFLHMYELLLFLALAGAYNGLMEELNVIQPYLDKWLQRSTSLTGDTLKTFSATLLISVIAANQTLPIILTGRSFLPHWKNYYGEEELARVMGDTTMLFPGMVPWSVLAIMCSTIVGVPILEYLPYALFLWVLPFITLIVSLVKHVKKSNKAAAAE
ncbi:NhaC family Na+:H+ antiporter [Neobacillus niacini]|jgi:NhaC family Na+:H+ antiporter|uniref:Na+/H+ antiporter NhaC family protein n=1 Tax=Neobacillus driksii TaxID=3035913 RepID=UPI00278496AD|nr:Na+/H+ antiporter NhaC family protein [Neobacillus niacini]MDQ0976490.1 NhaC family Na+:H+ antiporter [Neobacillus niacini]